MESYGFLYIFNDVLIFLVFTLSNIILIKSRFNAAKTAAVMGCCIAMIGLFNGYLYFYIGETFALTQTLLTAYVPVILCTHVLSKLGVMQTAAAWFTGILEYFCLNFLKKILRQLFTNLGTGEPAGSIASIAVLVILSVLMLWILYKYVREPFIRYVSESQINWLVPGLPIFLIFILFSYFSNAVTDTVVFILLFFTAASILGVIYKLLVSMDKARRVKEGEAALVLQMESQRRQYEEIHRKFEMGRSYRHDMRHHLAALEALIQQSDAKEAEEYIRELNGRFDQIEVEGFCENKTINAVLSFYIGQAREAGCKIESEVRLPEELPFEELDLCIVVSNALENAIQACKKLEERDRHIKLRVTFDDGQKAAISVENSCAENVDFDEEGLPLSTKGENHGIGLQNIRAVAKKYNGLFSCNLERRVFYTKVVLFGSTLDYVAQPVHRFSAKKAFQSALLTVTAVILSVNLFPQSVSAMEGIPVIGNMLRVVSLETYRLKWGDSSIHIEAPIVEMTSFDIGFLSARSERQKEKGKKGTVLSLEADKDGTSSLPEIPIDDPALEDAVSDLNEKMADYIKQMKEKFLWYVARKYDGYVALDTTYTILCNDEEKLSLRFDTTINAGGSGQYTRCFTLDKRAKKIIDLADLFRANSSYISVISKEILRQMRIQVDSGMADYFIPGGIWGDEECFKAIEADQNFYIDKDGKLVVVFDEYQVAPGSMGCPEFVIPTAVIKKMLKSNYLIK